MSIMLHMLGSILIKIVSSLLISIFKWFICFAKYKMLLFKLKLGSLSINISHCTVGSHYIIESHLTENLFNYSAFQLDRVNWWGSWKFSIVYNFRGSFTELISMVIAIQKAEINKQILSRATSLTCLVHTFGLAPLSCKASKPSKRHSEIPLQRGLQKHFPIRSVEKLWIGLCDLTVQWLLSISSRSHVRNPVEGFHHCLQNKMSHC